MKYFLCVLDFEATCWENDNHYKTMCKQMEIIEFPSIMYLIDEETNTQTHVSTFHKYVRPTINPVLSGFCTTLTGITQNMVDVADTFETVYKNHIKWIGVATMLQPGIPLVFATCGSWDLAIQLPRELKNKGLRPHKYYSNFIDVKQIFSSVYGKKSGGLNDLLAYFHLTFEGRPHSGIDDTKNIATCMLQIIRSGGWRYRCSHACSQ